MAERRERALITEAKGVFALGAPEEVMEYVHRLRDLPECGLEFAAVEAAHTAALQEEEKSRQARRQWRAEAERLLMLALKHWAPKEVEVALFGNRREARS